MTPSPGLCGSCRNARIIETRRGSRFYLCTLSETRPEFPRYPNLPVLRCRGYSPEPGMPHPEAAGSTLSNPEPDREENP